MSTVEVSSAASSPAPGGAVITNAPAAPATPAAPVHVVSTAVVPNARPIGQVRVTLFDIDPTKWPNYRTTVTEGYLNELSAQLGMNRNQEQIHNLTGMWIDSDPNPALVGKIGLVCGFCRYEAMCRNALQKLCAEFNEHFGYTKGKEGYVNCRGKQFLNRADRLRIRDAGPEWAEKYDAAMKSYQVNIEVVAVEEGADINKMAATKNLIEQTREDPSVWDTAEAVNGLIEKYGMTGKEVARTTGKTEAAISQIRAIFNLPNGLNELFTKANEAKEISDDILAQMKTATTALVAKCRRVKSDDASIPLSHARIMADALNNSNNPNKPGKKIKTLEFVRLLKTLVAMKQDGTIDEDRARVDYGVFQEQIREAIKASAPAAPAATPAAGAQTAGVPTAGTAVNTVNQPAAAAPATHATSATPATPAQAAAAAASSVTVEQLAAAQAAAAAEIAAANELDAAGGAAIPTAAAPAALPAFDDSAIMDQLGAGMAAALPVVPAATPSSTSGEISVGADGVALSEAEAGKLPATAKPSDGAQRIKAVDAVEQAVSLKPVPKIQQAALAYLETANSEENNGVPGMAERLANLMSASVCLETIGMSPLQGQVDSVAAPFIESFNEWLAKVNELTAKLPDADKLELQSLQPTYTPVKITIL